VVAQQIRKLADVTRTVSDQVNTLMRESNQAVATNVQMAQGMVQGYREIMEQSERIRQMIEANATAMDEVTRSHKEIQDGVAGVDRTIRTILEVSRDLREMTGSLAKTFSWFEEVLQIGEPEGAGEAAVLLKPEPSEPVAAAAPQPEEIPELEEGPEEEGLEEAFELVEALEEQEQPAETDDLFLAEDLDELGVAADVLQPEQPLAEEQAGEAAELQPVEETKPEPRDSEAESFNLEDVEELEAVEEDIEELEAANGSPPRPSTENQ
jgi:hypothetical protein